jgi:hypothetical protein
MTAKYLVVMFSPDKVNLSYNNQAIVNQYTFSYDRLNRYF